MALKPLNSVAGFSVGEVPNTVIYGNTDISTANIAVSGKSNLNSVSNVTITGGSPGYILSTDGSGNLSFISPPSSSSLTNGTSNVSIPTVNGNITLSVGGTANVLVVTTSGLEVTGAINPSSNVSYNLGNNTSRWNNVFANNGNFTSNVAVTGNLAAGGLLTDNLYYANGSPWDFILPSGSNTQIQYNDGAGGFGASANFTFNDATQVFTVLGNANVNNLGTTQVLASANVTAPQLISNIATGTAPFVVTSTTQVANLNVANAGYASSAGSADSATNASAVLANVESSGTVYPTFISATANANYSLQSNTAFNANLANGGFTATTFVGNLSGTTANVTGQLISTQATGTAPLSVASTTRVANLNVDYANVSDFEVVTTQTTGTFYPVFVNSSSTGNLALGSNSNLSFNAATGNLTTTILNATGNITAGTGISVTSGGMNVTGNISVTGNINVTGNLNYSNVTDLVVGDPLIYLGANNTGDLYDLGFVASYNDGTYKHTGLARNHVDDYWTFFDGVVEEPTTVIDWANATYPTVKAGNFLAVSNVTAAQVFATANVTTLQFISNVATGTAPLSVQSTTRVANLNVSYANVSDFGVVTSQSTGTYYPTFVNSSSTGNLALASNSAISANLANGGLIATTFVGNLSGTSSNVTTANVSGSVVLGNASVTTAITWDSTTTTSVSANQTIASISTTGVTGLEFLVKGVDDAGGGKYSVATVQAVTDGTSVDYSVFGTVNLGGSTGTLAVNISGGFVRLQVTPASSNSTVWTTQVRYI